MQLLMDFRDKGGMVASSREGKRGFGDLVPTAGDDDDDDDGDMVEAEDDDDAELARVGGTVSPAVTIPYGLEDEEVVGVKNADSWAKLKEVVPSSYAYTTVTLKNGPLRRVVSTTTNVEHLSAWKHVEAEKHRFGVPKAPKAPRDQRILVSLLNDTAPSSCIRFGARPTSSVPFREAVSTMGKFASAPPPPASWVWPLEKSHIEVEVAVSGKNGVENTWLRAEVLKMLVDGQFQAHIELPDGSDEWEDWFTWQDENVDWRRAQNVSSGKRRKSFDPCGTQTSTIPTRLGTSAIHIPLPAPMCAPALPRRAPSPEPASSPSPMPVLRLPPALAAIPLVVQSVHPVQSVQYAVLDPALAPALALAELSEPLSTERGCVDSTLDYMIGLSSKRRNAHTPTHVASSVDAVLPSEASVVEIAHSRGLMLMRDDTKTGFKNVECPQRSRRGTLYFIKGDPNRSPYRTAAEAQLAYASSAEGVEEQREYVYQFTAQGRHDLGVDIVKIQQGVKMDAAIQMNIDSARAELATATSNAQNASTLAAELDAVAGMATKVLDKIRIGADAAAGAERKLFDTMSQCEERADHACAIGGAFLRDATYLAIEDAYEHLMIAASDGGAAAPTPP